MEKFKLTIFIIIFIIFNFSIFSKEEIEQTKKTGYKVGFLKFLDLKDEKRDRIIPTYIFYPDSHSSSPYPLIIISHGFGADALTYKFLGEHLAIEGYVVFIPEHIGSNLERLLRSLGNILEGENKGFSILNIMDNLSDVDEFFNRPKDISFLIDKAIELNKSHSILKGMIDTSKVGIVGHSFGGYTVLASAGAEIDIPYLKENCPEDYDNIYDAAKSGVSFFQCRTLFSKFAKNIDKPINLADPRIKACIAMAPVTSKIFGSEGLSKIKIPVMIMGGDNDTTANYREEQVKTFSKFNPPKYLLILIGGNHLSFNGEPEEVIKRYELSDKLKGFYSMWGKLFTSEPALDVRRGHLYINTFSTAFFNYYLKGDVSFKDFLTQNYADELSQRRGELLLVSQP